MAWNVLRLGDMERGDLTRGGGLAKEAEPGVSHAKIEVV